MTAIVQSFPPVQTPLIGQNGILHPVWAKWFQQNYIQTGSSSSTTLTSLIATVAEQATEISSLQEAVTTLQNETIGTGHYL